MKLGYQGCILLVTFFSVGAFFSKLRNPVLLVPSAGNGRFRRFSILLSQKLADFAETLLVRSRQFETEVGFKVSVGTIQKLVGKVQFLPDSR